MQFGAETKKRFEMKTTIKLERVETNNGVVTIEGVICEEELVVNCLWRMSTDGWEEMDRNCFWANELYESCADIIIGRAIAKYGSSDKHVTRVVGS